MGTSPGILASWLQRGSCRLAKAAGAQPSWPDARWKVARRCGAKHISTSKCTKHTGFGPLLEVEMSKKCTPLWCEAYFEIKSVKDWQVRSTFGRFCLAGARDYAPCQKWAKRDGFVAVPKPMAGVGHLERIWHQIFRFAKMISRDRCSTSCDLASLFRGRRSTLDRWSGTIAKHKGTRPSPLHSTFHVWRTSRRLASFLMFSTSKIEEVLQTCCVFDAVNIENWGSLAG